MGNTQKNTPVDIQVRIDKLLDGDSSTKAFASATIGNAFAVHDIRITEKDDKETQNDIAALASFLSAVDPAAFPLVEEAVFLVLKAYGQCSDKE